MILESVESRNRFNRILIGQSAIGLTLSLYFIARLLLASTCRAVYEHNARIIISTIADILITSGISVNVEARVPISKGGYYRDIPYW